MRKLDAACAPIWLTDKSLGPHPQLLSQRLREANPLSCSFSPRELPCTQISTLNVSPLIRPLNPPILRGI